MLIGLSLVLTRFGFDFRYIAAVQKYGGPKMIWVVIWTKIWYIFPRLLKRGASRVECLWIFYERSLGPHCWCSIGGHLLGVGRWNGRMEDIEEIFNFYPFGYPLRQRFSELGDLPPQVWYDGRSIIGP